MVVESKEASRDSYLLKVPVTGGKAQRLSFGEEAHWVSTSRTGGRLVYPLYETNFDIWRTGGPTQVEAPPSIFPVSGTRNEMLPHYSPDGSKIAFISDHLGDSEVWLSDADGRNLRKLTDVGSAFLGEWSPSGDHIVFAAWEGRGEKQDIAVVASAGGLHRNLTPDEFMDAFPCWSIDGQSIYYQSLRDDWQIFKVSLDGGSPEQLTQNGGEVPRVSENGQVFFWRDGSIWSLSAEGGEDTLVLENRVKSFVNWCIWKDNIVYINQRQEGEAVIEIFNLRSGKTEPLHSLAEGPKIGNGLTVSPDGRWILFNFWEDTADLMLVEDFY